MSSPANDLPVGKGPAQEKDLKRLLCIELPVIAVIARKRMKLGEVVKFDVGSVIEFDKSSHELLDLMVNDQHVGRGEAARSGENFAIRIAEIGSVRETIRKLGGEPNTEKRA
jgi:flagellar motor switch protein FliN